VPGSRPDGLSPSGRLYDRPRSSRTTSPHKRVSRGLLKTVPYRFVVVCTAVVVALAVTGPTADASGIGLPTNPIGTATYYGHERW